MQRTVAPARQWHFWLELMDINPYQTPTTIEGEQPLLVADFASSGAVCDQCGGADFAAWEWWHPLQLHWILNPGLALNEVLFGQRVPSRLLVCQGCYQNWWSPAQQYAQCPHCHSLHRIETWTGPSAFGNWAGLICPDCDQRIPTLRNLATPILLVLLAPIWWPLSYLLAARLKRWGREQAIRGRERSYAKRPPRATIAHREGMA